MTDDTFELADDAIVRARRAGFRCIEVEDGTHPKPRLYGPLKSEQRDTLKDGPLR